MDGVVPTHDVVSGGALLPHDSTSGAQCAERSIPPPLLPVRDDSDEHPTPGADACSIVSASSKGRVRSRGRRQSARFPGGAPPKSARPAVQDGERHARLPASARSSLAKLGIQLVSFSLQEVKRLFTSLLQSWQPLRKFIIHWSFWRRRHQAIAKACHFRKRASQSQS